MSVKTVCLDDVAAIDCPLAVIDQMVVAPSNASPTLKQHWLNASC